MSSDTVISVEGLSKRYTLGTARKSGQYTTFRDVVANSARNLFRRQPRAENGSLKPEEFWALKDVSFEVKRGEVVGIIGRNGAGKSTLLKILSRITEPTNGKIELNGRVASLLEVGTGFHPELTGRENIFLNGAILGMHRHEIKAKFDEIVAFAEVEKFLDTPVKRYSSGMYVRLAFAVAAHLEPEILIVDEVLAVGDAEFQKKCLGKMQDVAQGQGRTILFVSHNMGAVQQLCSRILHMERGRLKRIGGDVRAVIQDYLAKPEDRAETSVWSNPGNHYASALFHPLRFQIVDGAGTPLFGPTASDTEMWIEIEAHIKQLDPSLTIGYDIYTQEGELLYRSYQTDSASENWPILSKSTIKLRSRLPSRFLNEGIYKIEMIGGLHHRHWLLEPGKDVPTVYLNIQGGLSDSPMWTVRRPGLMAPVMQWLTS